MKECSSRGGQESRGGERRTGAKRVAWIEEVARAVFGGQKAGRTIVGLVKSERRKALTAKADETSWNEWDEALHPGATD